MQLAVQVEFKSHRCQLELAATPFPTVLPLTNLFSTSTLHVRYNVLSLVPRLLRRGTLLRHCLAYDVD